MDRSESEGGLSRYRCRGSFRYTAWSGSSISESHDGIAASYAPSASNRAWTTRVSMQGISQAQTKSRSPLLALYSCMKPPDGPGPFPDIMDTPHSCKMGEPLAMLLALSDKDDLVHGRLQRINQPLDERLSQVGEEILLPAVHPAPFAADKNDRRSHVTAPCRKRSRPASLKPRFSKARICPTRSRVSR